MNNLCIPYFYIFSSFLLTSIWTLCLTVIPVFSDVPPNNYYSGHPYWYGGNDVIRFIEPVGGLSLQFLILLNSGIFEKPSSYEKYFTIFIFMIAGSIYVQGAGFHSASVMFKHSIGTLQEIKNDDLVQEIAFWMRNIWEHLISHYMYACGSAFMSFTQLLAYRNHTMSNEIYNYIDSDTNAPSYDMNTITWTIFTIAFLIYGLLIASVAAQFPSGCIVGLVYTIFYGLIFVGGLLYFKANKTIYLPQRIKSSDLTEFSNTEYGDLSNIQSHNILNLNTNNNVPNENKEKNLYLNINTGNGNQIKLKQMLIRFASRPVLLYFFLSYSFALLLILIWIAINGGLADRNSHNTASGI